MISVYIPGHAPAQQSWVCSGFFPLLAHWRWRWNIHLHVCMAVILVSAVLDFSVTVEVSFCGLLLYFAGQYLQDVSSPLGVERLVPLRSCLQREVWLGCSPTTCPALPACTPCCLWRQWLVSSPELPWVRAWRFSVNQMWTKLCGSGHSSSVPMEVFV